MIRANYATLTDRSNFFSINKQIYTPISEIESRRLKIESNLGYCFTSRYPGWCVNVRTVSGRHKKLSGNVNFPKHSKILISALHKDIFYCLGVFEG